MHKLFLSFLMLLLAVGCAPVVPKNDGGVLVVPYGTNNLEVKSGKVEIDTKYTFIFISKEVSHLSSTPDCYFTDDGTSTWVQKRYDTGMDYDVVIERTAGGAFVYLVKASDKSDQPQSVTGKFLLYEMNEGGMYEVSILLAQAQKTFHMTEVHKDCRVRGQKS